MTRRRVVLVVASLLVAAAAAAMWATAGPPRPLPTPPGTFAFAALGDAPYVPWEDLQYRLTVREIDAHDLAFVVHVGDIFWRPCTDDHYREVRGRFDRSAHPLFYTPGDNEWTDCWERGSGGFRPLERLESLRRIFFEAPERSFGRRAIPAETQAGDAAFPEFRENVRWRHEGVLFATVHIVGSVNGTARFRDRRKADDVEAPRRTEAAAAWVRATFAQAREVAASAVVIAFHGNPDFENPLRDLHHPAYEPFVTALEEEAERFGAPVLAVHGDEHDYIVDHPLRARNLTRLQVPGSPRVGWVRVVVDPRAPVPFAFDEHVVPRWKYW